MKRMAWIWLLVVLLLGGYAGLKVARGGAVETDLLAMLPATERRPAAEEGLQRLARATQDRAIFLVSTADPARTPEAALAFGAALRRHGLPAVQDRLPAIDPTAVARFYGPWRHHLAPAPPAGTDLEARLQARLASPFGAPGTSVTEDPLGTFSEALAALPLARSRLSVEGDLLVIRNEASLHVLVTTGLAGSAYAPDVQQATLQAVKAAEAETRRAWPDLQLLRTGAVFFAADARGRAEFETNLISWASTGFIILLCLGIFRSLRHLGLVFLSLAAGMAVACAACFALYGRLYLLTLVCGSSLLGVAVDYAFLAFAQQLGTGPWESVKALARIRPALVIGFATTVLGYLALALTSFPGLRQIGVFSVMGLTGSLLTVIWVFPEALRKPIPQRPRLMAGLARLFHAWIRLLQGRWVRLGAVAATLLLAASLVKVSTDDDVRGLIEPSRQLKAQEAKIRELTGLAATGRFFLVEGGSEGEVLAREEVLRGRLAPLQAAGLEGVQATSALVPAPAIQAAHLASHRRLQPDLETAMTRLGFQPQVVRAGRTALQEAPDRPLSVSDVHAQPFSVPFRMLWLGQRPDGTWASLVVPTGTVAPEALKAAAEGLPGTWLVDKVGSVTRLLATTRRMASWALGLGILLVGAALAWRYGLRTGIALVLPALGAILAALALPPLAGMPLSLFAVIGGLLTLGFAVDYTVFLHEGGHEDPVALLGVLLAGPATLASYALLLFSSTPVLRSFGAVLTLGTLVAVALAPAALLRKEA